DQPMLNLCNNVWSNAIHDELKARKLTVLLTGDIGNATVSYDGGELMAELLCSGQWARWARAVAAVVRHRNWRLRGAISASVAPWLPPCLWQLLCWLSRGWSYDLRKYSAIHPTRLTELNLRSRARDRGLDLAYRPWKDGVALRLRMLADVDLGNYNKGVLGGW